MKRRLRIPAVLACTIGSAAAVVAAVGVPSCGDTNPPIDSPVGCATYCIPDGTDAGVCPEPVQCADAGACPAGCMPVG